MENAIFLRFRQRNRDREWFYQIRESSFSFTCEAGGFTETETGTGFNKWITPSASDVRDKCVQGEAK